MADLESLTKTLAQIVGSLQEIIAMKSSSQGTLEPEPPLKKTP